jgi:two-component system chemotaxis response regulator CheY
MENRRKRVLIAEDNPALSRVLEFNLTGGGFDATVAPNGRVAWQHAAQEHFDVIITDQRMPEMTGVELCQQVRSLPRYAKTPIVMLTAKYLEMELPKIRDELNISATFPKPFSPQRIVREVEQLLVV